MAALADAPAVFLAQRRALIGEVDAAEAARQQASDAAGRRRDRSGGSRPRRAGRAGRRWRAAREARAASEARVEGARQRCELLRHAIAVELETEPAALAALAGLKGGEAPPDHAQVERKEGGL